MNDALAPFDPFPNETPDEARATSGALTLPSIPDPILTKRWAMRPKDVLDIQALEVLLRNASP